MSSFSNEQVSQNQNSSLSRSRRGIKKSTSSHSNMKSISKFILMLLHIYGELAMNTIILVVCQIVSESQLGKDILTRGLVEKEFDVVDAVQMKRSGAHNEDQPHFDNIMKNVKRRIYDVINVLVSSQVVVNDKKIIKLPIRENKKSEKVVALQNQIKEKEKKIEAGKVQIEKLQRKEQLVKSIYERKMIRNESQAVEKIMLPVAAVLLKPSSVISVESHYLEAKYISSLEAFGHQISIKKTYMPKPQEEEQVFDMEEESIESIQRPNQWPIQ